jgi:hypothetical protein
MQNKGEPGRSLSRTDEKPISLSPSGEKCARYDPKFASRGGGLMTEPAKVNVNSAMSAMSARVATPEATASARRRAVRS